MNIYKLKYENKEVGIADLIEKGIINEELENGQGTIAVVYIQPKEDENSYCIDLMLDREVEFENEVHPKTPTHEFAR